MKSLFLLLLGSLCFAGQGIVLGPGQVVYNDSIRALSPGTPYRIEESLQNLPTCSAALYHVIGPFIVNANIYLNCLANPNLLMLCLADNVCFQFVTNTLPDGFVTFRVQHFPSTMTDTCQAWDVNGNQVYNATASYAQENASSYSNGVSVGDGGGYAVNYARVYSATVATTSRPPVTTDTTANLIFEWKFDGNLNDSGPRHYNGILSSGAATYVTTLGESLVVPLITNPDLNPSWPAPIPGYQASWRAGHPADLSCTSSYSQSASPNVSCFWQVLLQPGQTEPFWSDQTSQTPTLTGLVFGDYAVQLTVTDQSGNTATALTHIGAVATDSNGVVVNANPAADAILGPMIAFGRNPWGLSDYWHLAGSIQRQAEYCAGNCGLSQSAIWAAGGISPQYPYATWEQPQAGTITYSWSGKGMNSSGGTTLNGPCSNTANSCTVTDASQLDLSSLPARIYVSTSSAPTKWEEIRVCSVTGNTLTFCYDGRGWPDPIGNPSRLSATSWNPGATVGQMKVAGSGTAFLKTLCPAGAPGPMGQISYNNGTVSLTAGSTEMTLSGGTWTTGTGGNVQGGYYAVVSASAAGSPFTFISPITTLTNATTIVLSRPFPSDATTASGLSYSIVNPDIFPDLGYQMLQGSSLVSFLKYWTNQWGTPDGFGCESDTSFYMAPYWDVPVLNSTTQRNQPYSYQIGIWWYNQSSTGGLDYYSEDLANLAGWLRSGLKQFHDSSMMIGDIWTRQPQKSNGGSGSLLYYGGPVIGGVANAMLSDTGHGTRWTDIRSFALPQVNLGTGMAGTAFDCNADDSREFGYRGAFLALAAEFDPDTTSSNAPGGISWHQYWQNALPQFAANEAACANQFGNTDNSWRTNFYSWPESRSVANAVTLTNGSATGTGTGLSNNFCFGIAQASNVAVTSGSSTVTGSGFPTTGWDRVAITGPGLVDRNGNPVPTLWVYATPNSSKQFTIGFGAVWPGSSSTTASVMFDNSSTAGDVLASFMSFEADPMSQYEWSCIYNSSSSITLNRPWNGTSGTNYAQTYNVNGFAVQPFMLGIRQYAWLQGQLATALTQPDVSSEFASLRTKAGVFEHNAAFDPVSGANYYAIQPACNPITLASMGDSVCYSGNPPTGPGAGYSYTAERVNTIENSMSLTDYYLSQGGSPSAVAWGDLMYGNCMGNPTFTSGGVYAASDGNTCDSSNGNLNSSTGWGLGAGKWYGFFFGIGASWRWPAQRLGGVQAAQPRAIFVGFDLGSVPSAASVQIMLTAPSGAQTSYACSASPCRVMVDDRQGSHLYRISYMSQSGHVLAQSQTALLD
jgi:hypothetical protein